MCRGEVTALKLFVTGISGLLGLNAALEFRDTYRMYGCWYRHPVAIPGVHTERVDLVDVAATRKAIEAARPDVIFHTAALADVDACEEAPAAAFAQNVLVSENVARAATEVGARLVHISTDHLFDGSRPLWTETDPVAPVNEYARTRYAAERAAAAACPHALIVRTNFFGWGSPIRQSFSDWVLRGLRLGQELTMFLDAYFTPILANDLVTLALRLLDTGAEGVYHVVGRDRLSKYEFALALADVFGCSQQQIRAVRMETIPLRAVRPRDLSLASDRAAARLGHAMPGLRESLERLRTLEATDWPGQLAAAIGCAR